MANKINNDNDENQKEAAKEMAACRKCGCTNVTVINIHREEVPAVELAARFRQPLVASRRSRRRGRLRQTSAVGATRRAPLSTPSPLGRLHRRQLAALPVLRVALRALRLTLRLSLRPCLRLTLRPPPPLNLLRTPLNLRLRRVCHTARPRAPSRRFRQATRYMQYIKYNVNVAATISVQARSSFRQPRRTRRQLPWAVAACLRVGRRLKLTTSASRWRRVSVSRWRQV